MKGVRLLCLSSSHAADGVPKVWGFAETPGLLAMLMKALLRTMREAGCHGCGRGGSDGDRSSRGSGSGGDENAFLGHDITVHKRFAHVFRDLEYALQVRFRSLFNVVVVVVVTNTVLFFVNYFQFYGVIGSEVRRKP